LTTIESAPDLDDSSARADFLHVVLSHMCLNHSSTKAHIINADTSLLHQRAIISIQNYSNQTIYVANELIHLCDKYNVGLYIYVPHCTVCIDYIMINVYHISDVMALFQTLIHKAPLASLVSRYSTPRVLYPNSITMTSRQMWIRNKTDSPVWFDTPTTFTHRLYRVGCNLTIPFGIEQFIPCQFVWNIFRLDLIK